jgi:hypothetical protein
MIGKQGWLFDHLNHPHDLIEILRTGTEKAKPIAEGTIEEVKRKMGLNSTYRLLAH